MKIPSLRYLAAMAVTWSVAHLAHAQSVAPSGDAAVPSTTAAPVASRPLPEERSWRLGAAFGYGQRTNPLIQSEDIPILVDLDIAWFGKRWFFDNGDLGFELFDHPRFTTNIVARVNSDRAFFSKTNIRFVNFALTTGGVTVPISTPPPTPGEPSGAVAPPQPLKVPKRDYAVELGVEVLFDGEWGQATLHGFHDVSNTHDGFEFSADYSYRWTRGRFSISPSLGVAYKSFKLSDYYWGVHPGDAGATLLQYQAGGGINWEGGLRTSYYLTKNTRLAMSANYERMHDSVAQSPIVEQPYVFGYFAGIAWQF